MTLSEARKRPLSQHKSDSIMGYSSTVDICAWPARAHLLEAETGRAPTYSRAGPDGTENKGTALHLPHPARKTLPGENRFEPLMLFYGPITPTTICFFVKTFCRCWSNQTKQKAERDVVTARECSDRGWASSWGQPGQPLPSKKSDLEQTGGRREGSLSRRSGKSLPGKLSLNPFSWRILCIQRTKLWNSEEKNSCAQSFLSLKHAAESFACSASSTLHS